MTALTHFKNRLWGRGDSEHEQAIVRAVIAGSFAFEIFSFAGPRGGWTEVERALSTGLLGYFVVAIGILAAIYFWPATNVSRRIVGMVADIGIATFYLWVAGPTGALMICVYLFVTLGNGFRYGRRYMLGCQALSLVGFLAAGFSVPYWIEHSTEWQASLATLLFVPLYVSTFLVRLEQARTRTEAALKECLDRNRT